MTEMEMLLGQEKSATALQRIEKILLPRLQECLALLSGTVTEFRAYFAADNRFEHYNPAEVIEQTLALLTWQQSLSHVQTDFTAPDPPRLITGHPATLAHVLMILVENALDIFQERQVETPRIDIALRMDAQHVHIIIADNGGGIEIDPIDQVFTGFTSAKRRQSSGMGLYIAQMLIQERLHGAISVENQNGGACFTLTLPRDADSAQAGHGSSATRKQ